MNWPDLLRSLPGYDPYRDAEGCWFDEEEAAFRIDFIESCCTHVKGFLAGKPLLLADHEKSIVANLFGWKREDGTRRYREAFIYLPRKNNKTTLCAAIANCVLFIDEEAGAENYCSAADRDQAGLLYSVAKGMVLNDHDLESRSKIYGTTKTIHFPATNSFLRAISAEANTKHGYNSHLVINDELHAQPNRELIDVLSTSTGARRQPLIIHITTADYMRESICNEKYTYACQVRDGVINDPSFLPVIYEALPEEDWKDEKVWAKANPNLGRSLSLDYLRRECAKAKEVPAYENTFRRLHLNQRTSAETKWLSDVLWMTPPNGEPFDLEILKDQTCWGGLDFGWRDDYASFVLVFNIDGVYYVMCWFWLPREGGRKKHLMPTAEFISLGLVELTPGNSTDIDCIYEVIRECRDLYDLREIAFDPANARKQGQDLINEGFQVFEFYQSKKNYNEACQMLVALLKEGKLRHGGNKVLRWQASNVQIEENGLGQIMPKKKRSMEKIDGICALTMALGRAQLAFTEVPEITFL